MIKSINHQAQTQQKPQDWLDHIQINGILF